MSNLSDAIGSGTIQAMKPRVYIETTIPSYLTAWRSRDVLRAAEGGSPRAALAYDRFVLSVRRAVGAMASVLGGLDVLVFTGGIGENSSQVRRDVASALSFAGVRLEEEKNRAAVPDVDIAPRDSSVRVLVVRAREELAILREMLRCTEPTRAAGPA